MILESSWGQALKNEFNASYFKEMMQFLEQEEKKGKEIFPAKESIFAAFELTPFEQVKVVILGQDPYHGEGQAHGLSFSVRSGTLLPPSLKNIYKELYRDLKIPIAEEGNLESWARQGVLLLNAALTVEKNKPLSHAKIGWARFTHAVIRRLIESKRPIIFMLWGRLAKEKYFQVSAKCEDSHIMLLQTSHPSPLSAHQGFLGCGHFSKVNDCLIKWGAVPIDWSLKKVAIRA